MVVSWGLVTQGIDNLNKIVRKGTDGLVEVLTPSKEDLKKQVFGATGPNAIVGGAGEIVKKTPEVVTRAIADNKYLKYAAIGGAALIGLAVLRRR